MSAVVLNVSSLISHVCGPRLIVIVEVVGADEQCKYLIWRALALRQSVKILLEQLASPPLCVIDHSMASIFITL